MQRFGDQFDYSGIQWRSYKSPVKIRCRKHPVQEITITPEKHLQTTGGCRHCLRERRVEALERELNRSAARPAAEIATAAANPIPQPKVDVSESVVV